MSNVVRDCIKKLNHASEIVRHRGEIQWMGGPACKVKLGETSTTEKGEVLLNVYAVGSLRCDVQLRGDDALHVLAHCA